MLQKFRENWVRPALFFGNNPISLAGGAITTASGVTMIGYWLVEILGRPYDNPYLGIIFILILPALFIAGLLLIPVGVFTRRRKLQKAGQIPAEFPKIDLNDRIFRHGLDIVLVATIANLLVVSIATYRGAAYMDSPQFCGQSCHVMHPEYTAYKISAHSHVACVDCHIGTGAQAYFSAKVNGTKQLLEVTFIATRRRFHRRFRICARPAIPARAATRRPGLSAKSCWSSRALPTTNRTPRPRRWWCCTWAGAIRSRI